MRLILIIHFIGMTLTGVGQDLEYTMVFLNSRADKEQLSDTEAEALQSAHLANIDQLVAEGKIVVAGPFENGGGIFVLSTGSLATAEEWILTDPAVKAKRWNIEIHPFGVAKGKICAPTEPYEMATYNFIRFSAQNEIADYKSSAAVNSTASELIMANKLAAQGNLLLLANYANNEGGMIIYLGDEQQELVENDPAVESGKLSVYVKKLWVAKGSFCEN